VYQPSALALTGPYETLQVFQAFIVTFVLITHLNDSISHWSDLRSALSPVYFALVAGDRSSWEPGLRRRRFRAGWTNLRAEGPRIDGRQLDAVELSMFPEICV
jgi:hypothetical protein